MLDEKPSLNLEREKLLKAARRIVVKVGTSTVTGADGELSQERVKPIVESIARLRAAGRQVVLVSSGAIGLGRGWLALHRSRLNDLVTKQACAAVGQSLLMNAYKDLFSSCGVKIAQVLLTEDDFSNWPRYSNLRRTMERLLEFGVLPIVNENDTVSTTELESVPSGTRKVAFSDNDRLAALVMSGLDADALVLLTNVDGFLKSVPHEHHRASQNGVHPGIVPVVDEVTRELRALAAGPSAGGRGGMLTKVEAAEIAMNCGGTAIIANGQRQEILDRIFAGEGVGTTFLPSKRLRGKRRWIAYAADVRGRVVVDQGARQAIVGGKASLLRSGVVRIESHFASMDVVSILDDAGTEFARGIANCASQETPDNPAKKRHPTAQSSRDASRILVRRDNIVLLETP
jgi:glutamate 5-kinase